MKRIYDKLETTQTFAGHRLRLSKAKVLATTTMKYPRQASNICVTHQKSFDYSFFMLAGRRPAKTQAHCDLSCKKSFWRAKESKIGRKSRLHTLFYPDTASPIITSTLILKFRSTFLDPTLKSLTRPFQELYKALWRAL